MRHPPLSSPGSRKGNYAALVKKVMESITSLEKSYDEQYTYLKNLVVESDRNLYFRLQSIPGVSDTAALGIICELGSDLSKFKSAKHLCSWGGLCPGNTESAGKRISGKCAKGNKCLRGILLEAAHACSRAKDCFLTDKAQKLKERRGKRKSVVALAHNLLRIIYAMIRDGSIFINSKTDLPEKFRLDKLKQAAKDLNNTAGLELEGSLVVKDKLTGEINARIEPQRQKKRRTDKECACALS